MMKYLTIIGERDLLSSRPAWYLGKAYKHASMRATILAPIPLNFAIGWWMNLIYPLLRRGPSARRQEESLRLAREEGYAMGLAEGIREGRKTAEVAFTHGVKSTLEYLGGISQGGEGGSLSGRG